jgi:hypothetical protein
MSIINRMRKQDATWWSRTGTNEFGRPVYADPVAIKCRWEDMTEEFISAQGTKESSKSVVYPDRILKPGDLVRLGAISADETDEYRVALENGDQRDLLEIRGFEAVPNIRVSQFLYTAYL